MPPQVLPVQLLFSVKNLEMLLITVSSILGLSYLVLMNQSPSFVTHDLVLTSHTVVSRVLYYPQQGQIGVSGVGNCGNGLAVHPAPRQVQ